MQKYLTRKTISIPVLFFTIIGLAWFGFAKYQEKQQKQAEVVRVEEEKRMEGDGLKAEADKQRETKEEIRNKKLIADLARINKEPLENTHLQIEQATENHVRGKVTFDFEPRKNGLFFATNVRYESSIEKAFGDLEIIGNEADESLGCEYAKKYSFPESMIQDCVKTIKNSTSSSMVVPEYWKLILDGNPAISCPRVYEGMVQVRAWYEWRRSYVENDWVVVVSRGDLSKMIIPFSDQPYFIANDISDSLREKLKNATSKQPTTLTIKSITVQCEGLPWITF